MAAHTPGPWSTAGRLPDAEFGPCVQLHVFAAADRAAFGTGTIATVHPVSAGSGEANALLLAAAPELADALEAIVGEQTDSYCEYCERHAPKDVQGHVVGSVEHRQQCPIPLALAALRKAGRL